MQFLTMLSHPCFGALDEIEELKGLGPVLKVLIAKFILTKFDLSYSEDRFYSEKE